MTISVRMNPLLEKELELAAKRLGVTKSQFVIDAVERALGRRDSYSLMKALVAEEETRACGATADPKAKAAAQAFEGYEQPYNTDASRAQLTAKLRAKHGIDSAR